MTQIAVVGAGIAGLNAALTLQDARIRKEENWCYIDQVMLEPV